MRSVFSRNAPILIFNNLSDQTDQDEQEGMMHLFEGAVLGIRNPGGHTFPEGTYSSVRLNIYRSLAFWHIAFKKQNDSSHLEWLEISLRKRLLL